MISKNLMRIIDKNSDKMPDGDYLELCNIMRDMYRAEADDETEPISARSLFRRPDFRRHSCR